MSEAIKTTVRVQIGQFAAAVYDLCEADKLDMKQLRNAVNAELNAMKASEPEKVTGKMAYKPGSDKKPETFKLSQSALAKFESKGGSAPMRFYLLNQELLKLEQAVGVIKLSCWPEWLVTWCAKFVQTEQPATEPAK